MANLDLRVYAQKKGVKHWQIAENLGISESVLCRKFRHELPQEEKESFIELVDKLASEGAVKNG